MGFMALRRTYGQGCGTAFALDVIGDRWALLVVRELLFGPKRFTDLRDGLPGVGPNVLSQRLKELEEAGVISHRQLPPPAASAVYELTDWGRELEDIVIRLGRWGVRSPNMPMEAETQPEWLMLGLRATFEPEEDPGPASYEFHFDGDVFWARVDGGDLKVGRGQAEDADAVLTADVETIAMLVRRQITPAAALKSGAVKFEGRRKALDRFPSLFKYPPSPASGGPLVHG